MSTNTILVAMAACVMVFGLALASDFLQTRYVMAVQKKAKERAARYSVAIWLVGVAGLIAVIKVGWVVLPGEALGLYIGTRLALKD